MQKVIFPFKTGQKNNAGFSMAARISRRTKSTLILLNAFEIKADDKITASIYRDMIRSNWIKASHEVMCLKKNYITNHAKVEDKLLIKYEYRFLNSAASREIIKIINEEEVLAIVLTVPKDKKHFDEFKSITIDIVDNHSVPIVVVPEDSRLNDIKTVAFATNFNKLENGSNYLDKCVWLTDTFNAHLHLVQITNDVQDRVIRDNEIRQKIDQLTRDNQKCTFHSLSGPGVLDILAKYVRDNNIGMLYTIGKERNLFEKLLRLGKGESIFLNSMIPVWIEHK